MSNSSLYIGVCRAIGAQAGFEKLLVPAHHLVTHGVVMGTATNAADLNNLIKRLSPRWFLMRDVHSDQGLVLLQPRWTMTYMRGPMTRNEIRRAREWRAAYPEPTGASGEYESPSGTFAQAMPGAGLCRVEFRRRTLASGRHSQTVFAGAA